MEYTHEILDRKTGELVTISNGDWITITELGALHGLGPRQTRVVLLSMNFMQHEGSGNKRRHRIANWVVEKNWGKRVQRKNQVPFDVIGPQAQTWVAARIASVMEALSAKETERVIEAREALEAFRSARNAYRQKLNKVEMPVQEMVSWLADYRSFLSHDEIARVLHVSQPLVTKYMTYRDVHLKHWIAVRSSLNSLSAARFGLPV